MTPRPRIVLLGWADSTPSQLRVFERLYNSLGMDPLSVIAPIVEGLLAPGTYQRVARPVAQLLADERGARPMLVHVFSDNGFATWGALLEALTATEGGRLALGVVRAIVFDSSPGLWDARGARALARYLSVGATSLVASRLGGAVLPRIATAAFWALFFGYRVVFRRAIRSVRVAVDQVAARQPVCPNLYLYGTADRIVLPDNVRAWIGLQETRGIACEAHEFTDADHVRLYSSDPERYRELLETFVAQVFRDPA